MEQHIENSSYQVIFYGAPGTGKSYRIKELLKAMNVSKENIFRTTFHPDSDYSSFVGTYKPTMKPVADKYKGVVGKDEEIAYSFVPQIFVKAYVHAYKKPEENVYLIIEEINRGNCAQIFGDLFQLLDRDDDGASEYTIKADADLRAYLEAEDVLGKDTGGIMDGELCLPSNLYIWATMNTSDQSLFPIDSAFKRRWDWEYEPIKYKNNGWVIEIGNNKYSWASFQKEVNKRIFEATNSEDKMLGDYFVKPSNGIISERLLLNKVLFYLWNDVCKDYDGDIFRTEDNRNVKFSDLYGENGTNMLISMMRHIGVSIMQEDSEEEEDPDFNVELSGNPDTKYSVNNGPAFQKTYLAFEVFKEYIKHFPDLTSAQVLERWKNKITEWKKSKITIPKHLIEDQNGYDKFLESSKSEEARKRNEGRLEPYRFKGETFYLWKGWGDGEHDNITPFMKAISESDWGISIKRIYSSKATHTN
ncbi:MAG: McrB family protein [Prevotella sp.]